MEGKSFDTVVAFGHLGNSATGCTLRDIIATVNATIATISETTDNTMEVTDNLFINVIFGVFLSQMYKFIFEKAKCLMNISPSLSKRFYKKGD